jgi:hypothetical protein
MDDVSGEMALPPRGIRWQFYVEIPVSVKNSAQNMLHELPLIALLGKWGIRKEEKKRKREAFFESCRKTGR